MENLLTIKALRFEQGENGKPMSLERFASAVGVPTKSRMSDIEAGKAKPTVDQAIAIENLSILHGVARIDAAGLNDDVKKARSACVAVCHADAAPPCAGADACASTPDSVAPDAVVVDCSGHFSSLHNGGDSGAMASAATGKGGEVSREVMV